MTAAAQQLDALKAHFDEQLARFDYDERIDALDGRITEATELISKRSDVPEEVKEQWLGIVRGLEQRIDVVEGNAQGLPPGGAANDDKPLRRSLADGEPILGKIRKRLDKKKKLKQLDQVNNGLLVPYRSMNQRLLKRETTVDTDELGQVITYRTPLVGWQLEATRLVDLIPTTPCSTEQYQWLKEDRISGEGGIHKVQAGAITGGTVSTTALDDVRNIIIGSVCTVRRTDGAGTLLGYEQLIVQSVSTPDVVFTTQIVGNIADNDIWSFNSYAGTAEAAEKPMAMVKSAYTSEDMITIALMMKLTKQAMRFNPQLEAWVESKSRKSNRRNKSRLLFYGTGSANQQLQGFLSFATRQTSLWSTGAVGDTQADAMYRASLLIPEEGAGLEATMRRADFQSMISKKAVDGHFVHGKLAPYAIIDTPTMKSVGPFMVHTDSQLKANGDWLLANHAEASELAINDTGEFLFGYVDDDFALNKVTSRYEEVLLHAILSEQGYVHGSFDAMPTP